MALKQSKEAQFPSAVQANGSGRGIPCAFAPRLRKAAWNYTALSRRRLAQKLNESLFTPLCCICAVVSGTLALSQSEPGFSEVAEGLGTPQERLFGEVRVRSVPSRKTPFSCQRFVHIKRAMRSAELGNWPGRFRNLHLFFYSKAVISGLSTKALPQGSPERKEKNISPELCNRSRSFPIIFTA